MIIKILIILSMVALVRPTQDPDEISPTQDPEEVIDSKTVIPDPDPNEINANKTDNTIDPKAIQEEERSLDEAKDGHIIGDHSCDVFCDVFKKRLSWFGNYCVPSCVTAQSEKKFLKQGFGEERLQLFGTLCYKHSITFQDCLGYLEKLNSKYPKSGQVAKLLDILSFLSTCENDRPKHVSEHNIYTTFLDLIMIDTTDADPMRSYKCTCEETYNILEFLTDRSTKNKLSIFYSSSSNSPGLKKPDNNLIDICMGTSKIIHFNNDQFMKMIAEDVKEKFNVDLKTLILMEGQPIAKSLWLKPGFESFSLKQIISLTIIGCKSNSAPSNINYISAPLEMDIVARAINSSVSYRNYQLFRLAAALTNNTEPTTQQELKDVSSPVPDEAHNVLKSCKMEDIMDMDVAEKVISNTNQHFQTILYCENGADEYVKSLYSNIAKYSKEYCNLIKGKQDSIAETDPKEDLPCCEMAIGKYYIEYGLYNGAYTKQYAEECAKLQVDHTACTKYFGHIIKSGCHESDAGSLIKSFAQSNLTPTDIEADLQYIPDLCKDQNIYYKKFCFNLVPCLKYYRKDSPILLKSDVFPLLDSLHDELRGGITKLDIYKIHFFQEKVFFISFNIA